MKKILTALTVISVLLGNFVPALSVAQTVTPTVGSSDLEYLGSFRLPRETAPASYWGAAYPTEFQSRDDLSFGGSIIGFDAVRQQLVVSTRRNRVALVSIPTPSKATVVTDLPFATYQSNFVNVGGDMLDQLGDPYSPASIYGGLPLGDKLITTGIIYYDANNSQRRGHIVSAWPPTGTTPQVVTPWRTVAGSYDQGMIAGYMAPIPSAWQVKLKGNVVSGQAGVPIITRTSTGPSLYSFNSNNLLTGASTDIVPAKMLVGYPTGHATLGPWEGASEIYGGTASITGVAMIDNTALFIGHNGLGYWCYGNGTSNLALHNTIGSDGERLCYDPSNSSKSQHAYPMRTQMWSYSLDDLARVANNEIEPWSLIPKYWGFKLPFSNELGGYVVGGMAYDEVNRKLYVSQSKSDEDGYSSRALIHVYKVNGSTSTSPTPLPPPPSVPTTITSVGANSVTSSSATVSWSTSQSSTSYVDYGLTTSYGQRKYSTGTFTHSALLSGLTAGSYYNYKVTATDASGNTVTSPNSVFFTLLSSTSPTPLPPPPPPTASTTTPTPPPPAPAPTPTPTPPTGNKFVSGDRVRVTVSKLNVRATSSGSGRNLGKQTLNSQGMVVSGPTLASGYNWYYIDYDKAPDGYSADLYLEKLTVATVPQSPEEIQAKITELKIQMAQLIEVLKAWLAR